MVSDSLKDRQVRETLRIRMREWRRGLAAVRVPKPTRMAHARSLGYKAKQGVVVVRVRVRKGGRRKSRPTRGRKPKRMGILKLTPKESIHAMSEKRAARKYPNLQVLNSYPLGSDGQHEYFEVILLDPSHPVIRSDPELSKVALSRPGRVFRGLTSAGKESRGLLKKGKGAERIRPGVRARGRK